MDKDYAKYLLEKTRQDYNLIAEEFSQRRERPWEETKFLFDNYLAVGGKALDLGCGNGRYFEFFREKRADYFGIDASDKLVKIAKGKYPEGKFQTADTFNLPFSDNFFDKIFSIAVLHHIPSEEMRLRFLTEVKRVLKPGGLLVLTVWKFSYFRELFLNLKLAILKLLGLSKLDFGDILEPWAKKINRYYHLFSQKELADLVEKADFNVKERGIIKNKRGNRQNIYLVAGK